jgi:Mn2+/Fe2+ NRAMP family transporter
LRVALGVHKPAIARGAVVQLLLVVQVVKGVLLPVLLIFIIRLVNKRAVMRRYTNGARKATTCGEPHPDARPLVAHIML